MKVGDYVRTKQGIEKIKVVEENFIGDENCIFYATDNKEWNGAYNGKYNGFTNRNRTIIKSSPNIIDLIEVGDYVNGHRVVEVDLDDIDDYGNTFRYIKTEHNYLLNYWVKENEIETILTKEQFESMEYKL